MTIRARHPRIWTRRLLAVWLVFGILLGGFDLVHAMKTALGDRDHDDTVVSMVDADFSKKSEHGTPSDHHCHGCVHFAQPSPFGAVIAFVADHAPVAKPVLRLTGQDPGTPLRPPAASLLT